MKAQKRGLFIVFEGLDRSGKSTQVKKLHAFFEQQKQPVKSICYPNRDGQSGELLNNYLKCSKKGDIGHEVAHLLFSMNRWEEKKQIIDMLGSGVNVICDRFAYSGVAYSQAKDLSFEWCLGADRGLVMPDLVIYFDVSADQLSEREGYGEEKFESLEFQRKVEQGYKKFVRRGVSDRDFLSTQSAKLPSRWVNLNLQAMPSIEKVHEQIIRIIKKYQSQFAQNFSSSQLNKRLFKETCASQTVDLRQLSAPQRPRLILFGNQSAGSYNSKSSVLDFRGLANQKSHPRHFKIGRVFSLEQAEPEDIKAPKNNKRQRRA